MRVTLADKMKEAFAKAGQSLSGNRSADNPNQTQSRTNNSPQISGGLVGHTNKSKAPSKAIRKVDSSGGSEGGHEKKPVSTAAKKDTKFQKKINPASTRLPYDALSVYREGLSGKKSVAVNNGVEFDYKLLLSDLSTPCWTSSPKDSDPKLLELDLSGQQVQPTPTAGVSSCTDRELVLGLDFGSSTVKAVVGDSAIDKAFAVQFRAASGLAGYLLPCRLYKDDNIFSLSPGGVPVADLKLSLLASPTSTERQVQVVAFLALVIRRVRAWFFSAQESVYRSSNIFWRMALGLPTANHLEPELADVFRLLAMAAWVLAGDGDSEVTESGVKSALRRAGELEKGESPSPGEDLELSVIPEIAAQIYGYVASEKFDRKHENNYMMVDIGGGTVDAALFHVKPSRGNKWEFEFFTATVEPRGTMNLHRHRLRWWEEAIKKDYPQRHDLLGAICDGQRVTDIQSAIPGRLDDYFSESDLSFGAQHRSADKGFYSDVFSQVGNRTYYAASEQGHLSRESLTGIPVYLCGGGSHMPFYSKLRDSMRRHPSFSSWMRAEYRRLSLPKGLVAPEVLQEDYDRLSVAYGLSFLNIGKIIKLVPKAKVPVSYSDSWRDNYIDK